MLMVLSVHDYAPVGLPSTIRAGEPLAAHHAATADDQLAKRNVSPTLAERRREGGEDLCGSR